MALASPSEPGQLQPVQDKDFVISAKHLTKKFGDETAVQDVSFERYQTDQSKLKCAGAL